MSTWVMAANARRARVLETFGPGQDFHFVRKLILNAAGSSTAPDRPSRRQDGSPFGKSAVSEFHSSELHEAAFARQLASELDAALAAGCCNRIILAATPGMLAALHKVLSQPVRDAISGEIDRDLTHLLETEFAARCAGMIAA